MRLVGRVGITSVVAFVGLGCNGSNLERSGPPAGSPSIDVHPVALTFRAALGGQDSKTATLTNEGALPLEVTSLDPQPSAFAWSLLSAPALPFTIQPGASVTVDVGFSPQVVDPENGTLSISSDDPAEPTLVVPLEGTTRPEHVETFTAAAAQADFLFAVESAGMELEERNATEAGMSAFGDWLASSGLDFEAGVTSCVPPGSGSGAGTEGRLLTPPLTPGSASLGATLQSQASSADSTGFNADDCLSATLAAVGGANGAFPRPGAALFVFFFTDEHSLVALGSYQTSMTSAKGSSSLLHYYAATEPGDVYQQLIQATGGAFTSFENLSFQPIFTAAEGSVQTAQAAAFHLSFPADPATIQVVVDGVAQAEGSAWIFQGGSIVFLPGSVPASGAAVTVSYLEP